MRDYTSLLLRIDAKAQVLATQNTRALAQGEVLATVLLLEQSAKAIRELLTEAMQKELARV